MKRNFADPDYEPTDDDLLALSHEAFAGIRETHENALVELRARIAKRSEEALADLRRKLATEAGS